MGGPIRGVAIVTSLVTLASCVPHAPRRLSHATAVETTVSHLAERPARKEVGKYSVESHPTFDVAFVEFDDQGRLWDLEQVESMKRALASAVQRSDGAGVGIIAFAHGWEHDARVCDDFVACFRTFLAEIAADTGVAAAAAGVGAPRIVGVYLGWRGRSVVFPVASQLTFWPRKRTAERIGAGELVEVLEYLDLFTHRENGAGRLASLSIMGHSFGGTMVYTALANTLKARLVDALERHAHAPTEAGFVHGFGDLVLLINPAFEASALAPLHELADALGTCSPRQAPVLVVIGSENDIPSRVWFRTGRWAQTFMQSAGPRSEGHLLTTAVGSYDPFLTHRVEAVVPTEAREKAHVADCACELPIGDLSAEESQRIGDFLRTRRFASPWGSEEVCEECEGGLALGTARLTCLQAVMPTRPVWSVRATDDVVDGHSGFFTRPFLDFVRYLILGALSSPITSE